MRIRGWILLAALALAITAAAVSCTKNDNKTNPVGSGAELGLNLPVGVSVQHTFNTAGTFPYHCSIHTVMHDTITVATGGADSLLVVAVNTTATGFQRQSAGPIRPGGTVRWFNASAAPHTVTSD